MAKSNKFIVQWHLQHDGKDYQAGDELTLEAQAAEPLLTTGVIVNPSDAAAES